MQQEKRTNPDRRSNPIAWDGLTERRRSSRRIHETDASLADQLRHHLAVGQFGDPAATLRKMAESNCAIAVHQALRSITFSAGLPYSVVLKIAAAEIERITKGENDLDRSHL